MNTNSYGDSAASRSEGQQSGIRARATVGNRRKSIDVIRFRAQPDEEQNRVYGDGDEFNPDRTRMFARMKRETMRCKHCSDEMNERRRKMRLEQDVPTMNYVCKKNRGIANGIDKDSQNLKNGQVSVPSSSHVRAEDGYDEGRSIHADGEPFKSTIRGKDEVPSVNFATRADDEEDVRSKEDESGMKDKQKRDAGYKKVSTNNRWIIAKDMGYDYDDVSKGDFNGQGEGYPRTRNEASDYDRERRSEGHVQEGETIQHYVLFAGSDWHGMKRLQKGNVSISSRLEDNG
ncbi:hypothetical protein HanXRQr2_Chr07g0312631 [Helianthus annuus]|uniref:Uncharacterized protein n=1 Tax=Helianthus annuus TaxID=4232 RepID=A0A9K3IPB2_HELAN|nr:hypothetical protein HanXRQr2_Chr07g0312631 [Helianthus annuus]KAJ0551501.1 hypothetical protein HanHA300_Chr07g0257831 [Helianthus annuus]KAJ0558565.1 hypothetical protein HanIR_Chr07g0337711 [Helianthus annuus]KAJ0732527.1 hypothetical protein HanOQP8_Chr07g0264191 [Helianthus annuus]KAJ0823812.1 hypothetical protein HanLR1_Chr00c0181g0726261 [Helianthus annuus]